MAIARTASGKIGATASVTGISGAFDCVGGDFLIAFAIRQNTTVQTCTYNGVSMTLINSTSLSSSLNIDVFYLIAPSSGSNTLASVGSGSTYRTLLALAYSGTKQSGQPDNSSFAVTSSGTSKTLSITPVAANAWIAGIYTNDNGPGTITANNSAVKISSFADPGSDDMLWDTNTPIVTPAATTVGGQSTNSGNQGLVAISIAPVVATATANPAFLLRMI